MSSKSVGAEESAAAAAARKIEIKEELASRKASREVPEEVKVPGEASWTANHTVAVSIGALSFGLVAVAIAGVLLLRGKPADGVLRVVGMITIVTGAVFLVVTGYSDKQMVPAIALLGTIAGYLLGRGDRETADERPRQD